MRTPRPSLHALLASSGWNYPTVTETPPGPNGGSEEAGEVAAAVREAPHERPDGGRVLQVGRVQGRALEVLAETREQGAVAWIDGSTVSITSRLVDPSNAPSCAGPENVLNDVPYYRDGGGQSIDMACGPSSSHAGTVAQLRADGSVDFLADSTRAAVYDALITRAGHD